MNWLTMHLDTGLPPRVLLRVSQGHRASLWPSQVHCLRVTNCAA